MRTFRFGIPTNVLFGAGTINQVKDVAGPLGKKALLVTGRGSARRSGVLDLVVGKLKEAGVAVIVNEEVEPNARAAYVDRMANVVVDEKCDFVIGLGGGSSMDAAKAIALITANKASILDFFPGGRRADMRGVKNALPIMAITTTAGTGSEVTQVAVITDAETKRKPALFHNSMHPAVSIVDPDLMLTMPPEVTAATGADALFHSLETLISKNATPFTDIVAQEAVRLVVANLETAYRDGGNREARANMAWANTLAGLSIDNGSPVAIHGLSHPISGHFDAAHGRALAAVSVAFLNYTCDADVDRYARLSRLLGVSDGGLTQEQLAARSGDALKAFLSTVDLDITISELGVTKDRLEQFADEAFITAGGAIKASLKPLEVADVVNIYEMSL